MRLVISTRSNQMQLLATNKTQAEEANINNGHKISKKIVRFADVLGLDLERVKTFMDEIPKVPLSAFKDLSLSDITNEDNESSKPVRSLSAPPRVFHKTNNPSTPADDRIILPNFHQPFTQPDFYQELCEKRVKLETAYSDHNSQIIGTVRVINVGFEKHVHIRCSHDDWLTWNEIEATYNPACHDVTTDKFTFKVPINSRLSFAIRYECSGQEFWDNNNGANYSFNSIPNAVPSYNHVYNQIHW